MRLTHTALKFRPLLGFDVGHEVVVAFIAVREGGTGFPLKGTA